MTLSIVYQNHNWHGIITDEHMRRIFRPEAKRPASWVNGPQIPPWRWEI
jgi:hypothetical protein